MRPGGRIALLDASEPDNPVLRAGHGVYFNRVVPLIGGLALERRRVLVPAAVDGLPARAGRDAAMLREAGFPDAVRHQLSGGLTQLLVGTRS